MAKDVASRVSGGEASSAELREQAEHAAAQFTSIHERWSFSATGAPRAAGEPLAEADAAEWAPETTRESGLSSPDAVSVTPILGITTDTDDSASRPRFKTLTGVPRSSPEIDDLAGLELDPPRLRDTIRLERPSLRVPVSPQPTGEGNRGNVKKEEPSLAATSWPWERNPQLAPTSGRGVAPQWVALVEGSLDVSAEVAALRPARSRRPWLLTLVAVVAAVGLFCVAAPRERKLAWRWMQREARSRFQPADALTGTARALRPAPRLVEPAGSSLPEATALVERAAAASAEPMRSGPSGGGAKLEPLPPIGVRDTERVAETYSNGTPAAAATEVEAPASGEDSAAAATKPSPTAGVASLPTKAAPTAHAQVGAARKRSQRPATALDVAASQAAGSRAALSSRGATSQPATARAAAKLPDAQPAVPSPAATKQADAKPVAAKPVAAKQAAIKQPVTKQTPAKQAAIKQPVTKQRAVRQNSPRKDSGDGIIRQTPF